MNSIIKTIVFLFIIIFSCLSGYTQFRTAKELGIMADGTDQSHKINAALAMPSVQTIWFANDSTNSPALFLIDSTVSVPYGKVLKFESGNRVYAYRHRINTVTKFDTVGVYGGIIDASLDYWIFDTTLTVLPAGTANGWFSVRWYGAR